LFLHFSGCFLLTASLRRRRKSVYISLFTVAIPVNYTSEFQELLEATMYVFINGACSHVTYEQTKIKSKSHLNLVQTSVFCTMPFIATLYEMCTRSAFLFQKHLILATVLIWGF
jgi:hypothetical protein